MKRNMSGLDQIIRLSIAVVIAVLLYFDVISGMFGIVMVFIAVLALTTGIVGTCPLYAAFGIYTNSTKKKDSD